MLTRGTTLSLLAGVIILTFATPAMVCPGCSGRSLCCMPGFALFGGHIALLLAVLSAFIERPFFTLAGVHRRALGFSILANLISMLLTSIAGFFVMGIAWGGIGAGGEVLLLLWLPGAVVLSGYIEHMWVARTWRRPRLRVKRGWLMAGNIISAIAIATLPIWTELFRTTSYAHYARIYGLREQAVVWTVVACILAYIIAFITTRGVEPAEPEEGDGPQGPRGFEVLPAQAGKADQLSATASEAAEIR